MNCQEARRIFARGYNQAAEDLKIMPYERLSNQKQQCIEHAVAVLLHEISVQLEETVKGA